MGYFDEPKRKVRTIEMLEISYVCKIKFLAIFLFASGFINRFKKSTKPLYFQ